MLNHRITHKRIPAVNCWGILLIGAVRLVWGDVARAEIIYSGNQNIAIPADFNGVFIDVFSLQHSTTEFSGWDLNPFFGGLGIANSPGFQPVRIGAGSEDSIAPISFGSIINGTALFSSGYGGSGAEDDSGHLGPYTGQFVDGQSAYMGFKLFQSGSSFYGWMQLTLTSNGSTGVIQNWAYDNSGAAIRAGALADVGAAPKIIQAGETQAASAANAGSAIMLDSGANFTFQENASGGHFAGNIQGGGELKISGAGGVRLSGINSFSGTAAVLAGSRLTVTTKENLGTAAVQLNSASALVFESLATNNGAKNTCLECDHRHCRNWDSQEYGQRHRGADWRLVEKWFGSRIFIRFLRSERCYHRQFGQFGSRGGCGDGHAADVELVQRTHLHSQRRNSQCLRSRRPADLTRSFGNDSRRQWQRIFPVAPLRR
jgi:hypothetical protein